MLRRFSLWKIGLDEMMKKHNRPGRKGLRKISKLFIFARFHRYYDAPYGSSWTPTQLCYVSKKWKNFQMSHGIPIFGRGRKMNKKVFR